jgi:hypothetical protein
MRKSKYRILNKPTAIQVDKRGKFVNIYSNFILYNDIVQLGNLYKWTDYLLDRCTLQIPFFVIEEYRVLTIKKNIYILKSPLIRNTFSLFAELNFNWKYH